MCSFNQTNFEMFWFYNSFHEQFKDLSWEFVWKTWENVRFFRLPIPQMCCKRRIAYCATMSIEKETYCFTRKIVMFESVMIRQESVKIILLVVKLSLLHWCAGWSWNRSRWKVNWAQSCPHHQQFFTFPGWALHSTWDVMDIYEKSMVKKVECEWNRGQK